MWNTLINLGVLCGGIDILYLFRHTKMKEKLVKLTQKMKFVSFFLVAE